MESSSQANIVEIKRLIEHFDDENISVFKQYLLKEVGCHTEQEWLCYIVKFLSQSMTSQSIVTLKHKAIEIAQTQSVNYEYTTTSSKSLNLYKWMQQQYSDKLSCLPSDIIDHIG